MRRRARSRLPKRAFAVCVSTGDDAGVVPSDGGAGGDDGGSVNEDGGAGDDDAGGNNPDSATPAMSCRGQGDCSGNGPSGTPLGCAGPDELPVCGILPRQGCSSNADCGADACHAIDDPCSPDGVGSECRPVCTVETNCGSGFRCNSVGACEAIRCDEDFVCAQPLRCDPTSLSMGAPVHEQHHGCVLVTCTVDTERDDGLFCVNGICQRELGARMELTAVP